MSAEQAADAAERQRRPGDPCVMVIFGATGDLTKRLLMPSLYNLKVSGLLPDKFAVVGVSNIDLSDQAFREEMAAAAREHATGDFDPATWAWFGERLHYVTGTFDDAATFERLKQKLDAVAKGAAIPANHLYYFATAPTFFATIAERLGAAGLAAAPAGQWRRVVIEKPFGHDLESAVALNKSLTKVLEEEQIYRIDHYMGKETVQNLMVFRFGNSMFEPIWNRRYIEHVQITAAETLGVEKRAGYFEGAGTLRDMVPNHLFQLLALTAMEPPVSFDAKAVRDEKAKVLSALQIPTEEQVLTHAVRGQYGAGEIAGALVPAYRAEPGVAPASSTETYAALKVSIDNWRWASVPFYLRTGKRMAARETRISIHFRKPPLHLFRHTGVDALEQNVLTIHVQPDEGISLRFGAKIPGPTVDIGDVEMKFKYAEYFHARPAIGYETLLHDCMIGDQTLFQRADMTEYGWRVIQPVLDVWRALHPRDFPNYAAGSWGPPEADELLRRDGRLTAAAVSSSRATSAARTRASRSSRRTTASSARPRWRLCPAAVTPRSRRSCSSSARAIPSRSPRRAWASRGPSSAGAWPRRICPGPRTPRASRRSWASRARS
jgi:glucose-6-phosphate 1-dehydrogenase